MEQSAAPVGAFAVGRADLVCRRIAASGPALDAELLRRGMAPLTDHHCAAVRLGEPLNLAVLASRLSRVARRFFGGAPFHDSALAEGMAGLLSRLGAGCPVGRPSRAIVAPSPQRVFSFR